MSFSITRHNSQPDTEIPTGHTRETAAELTGASVNRPTRVFEYDAPATLDNADQDIAIDAIYDDIETEVSTNVLVGVDGLGLDPADTTAVRIVVTSIRRGFAEFDINDYQNQYQVGTPVFKCKYKLEWKTTAVA